MKKIILLFILLPSFISIYSQDLTNDFTSEEIESIIAYESSHPAFAQKGGMLRKGEHSFFLRTNDEWTGFTSLTIGYRYGVHEYFNISVEGGASLIPHVYLGIIMFHFKLFESLDKKLFIGARVRGGYKYQDSNFDTALWENVVGKNYLVLKRNGLFIATDFTVAVRFGRMKNHAFYYTIYPRFDFDFAGGPIFIMFSPCMIGYEVRFGKRMRWNIAVESGITIPLPVDSIPMNQWVNFPSLLNMHIGYRFGDSFYKEKKIQWFKLWDYFKKTRKLKK